MVAYAVWEWLAFSALLFAIVIVATWAHLHFWVARLSLDVPYSIVERLACADGGFVELRRVPIPEGVPRAALPPVVLVHGLAANHRNQDMHPDYSLARHLAALGRDVWLPTLRSGQPHLPRALRRQCSFEAIAKNDVPRAIDEVLLRTGAETIDYVGFSMGGMLLYAVLDRVVPRARFRRVVTVGSPGEVKPLIPTSSLLRHVPRWMVPAIPFRLGARLIAFVAESFTTPFHKWVLNPKNVAKGVTQLALVDCIEDIPAALIYDFMRWSSTDGVVRVGDDAVLPHLAQMDLPALFVAGSADHLAPPAAVRHAFDVWGRAHPSVPKRFVVLGRDYGSEQDYGHGDLALGAYVGVELFAPIARFLGPDEERDVAGAKLGAAAREAIDRREAVAETTTHG